MVKTGSGDNVAANFAKETISSSRGYSQLCMSVLSNEFDGEILSQDRTASIRIRGMRASGTTRVLRFYHVANHKFSQWSPAVVEVSDHGDLYTIEDPPPTDFR